MDIDDQYERQVLYFLVLRAENTRLSANKIDRVH